MAKQIQKYEQVEQKWKRIVINNFLGGISWGLGATIGLSLVIAILGFIASKINLVPIFGTFISHIIDFILATNHHLQK